MGSIIKWTIDKLQEEVDKHNTRKEFNNVNHTAYNQAYRRKLLDELFKNHVNNGYSKREPNIWTIDKLQEEVNKYETRGEFHKNHNAYNQAHRRKLLDELFKNHVNQGYSNIYEWVENSYVIYVYEFEMFNTCYVGLTNNIERRDIEHLYDLKENMSYFCKENNISLPKYKILEENLNAKNVRPQEKYWEKYYSDNGYTTLNIAKTGSLGGGTKKWTKKALQEEVNKYETRGEFAKFSPNESAIVCRRRLIDELFKNHYNQGYDENFKQSGYWTKEKCIESASKYKTNTEWLENENTAYQKALLNLWLDECRVHMSVNKNRGYWTKELCIIEASKYKTSCEWIENDNNSYSAASRNEWLGECTTHMIKRIKWTIEMCINYASKYKTSGEWKENNKYSYQKACAHKWLEECKKYLISD